jgi:hypothetical protein
MDIQNLTGLETPLTKLIETVSEGVGVLGNHLFEFDAKKIKRIGSAEANIAKEKIIKKAEGDIEVEEIMTRAKTRFALNQYNKQVNLENIVADTKELLEGKAVSEEPVEKDWTAKFMNIAQDVSRDDVQKLLSRILAGEIIKSNSFSFRTLDFIKNLTQNDLFLLKDF